jgi:hypothetical protein
VAFSNAGAGVSWSFALGTTVTNQFFNWGAAAFSIRQKRKKKRRLT